MRTLTNHYERLTTVAVDDVVKHIGLPPLRPTIEIMGQTIKLFSLRLRTFAKSGTTCHGCGLEASHWGVERAKNDGTTTYHVNLYGVNLLGVEVMLTCDHVLAKAKGGANDLSNTQTLCIVCNNKKADH